MTTQETKDRILDAAVRLFTAKGVEAVSLRAVTAEAGVNIAAVNYHFGSKAALLQAMLRRFFTTVNTEQLHLLEALEERDQQPTVEELLLAFATPLFRLFDTDQGREWVRAWMLARGGEPTGHAATRTDGEEGETVTRRYYEALRRALPHLSPDELWWRFERTRNLVMANQGRQAIPSTASEARSRRVRHAQRDWLMTFLAGALKAPATDEHVRRAP